MKFSKNEIIGFYKKGFPVYRIIEQAKQEKAKEIEKRFEDWENNRGAYVLEEKYRNELKNLLFKEHLED